VVLEWEQEAGLSHVNLDAMSRVLTMISFTLVFEGGERGAQAYVPDLLFWKYRDRILEYARRSQAA